MILDLNRYRKTIKPLVKLHIARNPDSDLNMNLSMIAQSTSCHILAVSYYLGELFGFSEELESKIVRLQTFYHYVTVTNKEKQDDSTPGEI